MKWSKKAANRIKVARVNKGLSLEDFAKGISKPVYTVRSIESGKVQPAADLLEKICTVLGESVVWIMKGEKAEISAEVPVAEQPAAADAPAVKQPEEETHETHDDHAVEMFPGNTVGERLIYARKWSKVTIKNAAKAAGISAGVLYYFEHEGSPKPEIVASLCKAYGCDVAQVATEADFLAREEKAADARKARIETLQKNRAAKQHAEPVMETFETPDFVKGDDEILEYGEKEAEAAVVVETPVEPDPEPIVQYAEPDPALEISEDEFTPEPVVQESGKTVPVEKVKASNESQMIAKTIREKRIKDGKTIAEYADLLGESTGRYEEIETGFVEFTISDIARICKYLRIDPEVLIKEAFVERWFVFMPAAPVYFYSMCGVCEDKGIEYEKDKKTQSVRVFTTRETLDKFVTNMQIKGDII